MRGATNKPRYQSGVPDGKSAPGPQRMYISLSLSIYIYIYIHRYYIYIYIYMHVCMYQSGVLTEEAPGVRIGS